MKFIDENRFKLKKGSLTSFNWESFDGKDPSVFEIKGLCTKIRKRGLNTVFTVKYRVHKT